jgi:hypothetical protein
MICLSFSLSDDEHHRELKKLTKSMAQRISVYGAALNIFRASRSCSSHNFCVSVVSLQSFLFVFELHVRAGLVYHFTCHLTSSFHAILMPPSHTILSQDVFTLSSLITIDVIDNSGIAQAVVPEYR